MSKLDATIIKTLADIGHLSEPTLTPEQEHQLFLALNPEEQFLDNVERLFSKNQNKRDPE